MTTTAAPLRSTRQDRGTTRGTARRRSTGPLISQPLGSTRWKAPTPPASHRARSGRHPDGRPLTEGLQMSEPTGSATHAAATESRGVSSCTMTGQPDPDFAHRPVMADEIVELFAPVPAGWLVDATLGGAATPAPCSRPTPSCSVARASTRTPTRSPPPAAPPRRASAAGLAPRRARFDRLAAVVATRSPAASPSSASSSTSGSARRSSTGPIAGFSYRLDAPARHAHGPRRRAAAPTTWSTATPRPSWPACCATYGDERFAAPHRPGHRRRPPGAHHRRAGRDRARRHPRAGPPQGRPPGQAHVPGHPHRGQRRARRARRGASTTPSTRSRPVAASRCSSYHSGEDRIVKERPARGRDRRLHLPARAALRLRGRRHRPPPAPRRPAHPSAAELERNPRAESARLRSAEKLAAAEVDR